MKLYVLTILEPDGPDLIQRIFRTFEEAKKGYLAYLGSWVSGIVFVDKGTFPLNFFENPCYYSDDKTELYASFGNEEHGHTLIYIKEFSF